MPTDSSRREFLRGGTMAAAGFLVAGAAKAEEPSHEESHAGHGAADPHAGHGPGVSAAEFPRDRPSGGWPVGSLNDRGRLVPGFRDPGEPPVPVEAPDLEKLPWEMVGGVKEFHLYCRHTPREFLPDLSIDVWGFNGSMPGPVIEAVEGDRVRFVVHNELPEPTAIHWHGLEMPNRFDGVGGLTQDPIEPGQSYAYEFDLHQNGTFFYHSHGAMQEAIGMVGPLIVHPREAHLPPVDRDVVLVLQEWAILPGSTVPNTLSMEFNFFTINGRTAPHTTPIVLRLGERVRLRLINFSVIDHHPMHIHGVTFWVTGNESGRIPESAWVPGNNVLVAVAQARDVEFVANNPGDWPLHCHMFHHMMNSMASMVGMAGGHTRQGPLAGAGMAASMGMLTRGPALSEENGRALGRGLGEGTGSDRTARTGPPMQGGGAGAGGHEGHGGAGGAGTDGVGGARGRADAGRAPAASLAGDDPRYQVPGFPQDMQMTMYTAEQLAKINKRETRGMRRHWYKDVAGLMTIVRILPEDLYRRVMETDEPVEPGASVPGGGAGDGRTGHMHGNAKPASGEHGAAGGGGPGGHAGHRR